MYIKVLWTMMVFFSVCGVLATFSGASEQAAYFGICTLLFLVLIETCEISRKLDRMNGT